MVSHRQVHGPDRGRPPGTSRSISPPSSRAIDDLELKLNPPIPLVAQAETYACQKTAEFIPDFHDHIWGGSAISSAIPKGYGAVILVNVIGASLALVTLSFKVSAARKEYKVDLPAMYATGKDKKSVTFNCIQRGHQQALETFPTILASSLIGGIRYPLSVWLFGCGYIKARLEWAKGYASGDPQNRYSNMWAKHIWTTLVGLQVAAIAVAVELLVK